MADHDRARRRWVGCEPLQSPQSAGTVGRQPADLLSNVWGHGCDRVVVGGLDAHDARRLRRAKADGEHGAEDDREFPEDLPRQAPTDDALHAVRALHRFDKAIEDGEQCSVVACICGVLPCPERDIGRRQ